MHASHICSCSRDAIYRVSTNMRCFQPGFWTILGLRPIQYGSCNKLMPNDRRAFRSECPYKAHLHTEMVSVLNQIIEGSIPVI